MFSAPTSFVVGMSPAGIDPTDVSSDGHQDLIVANSAVNSVSVLRGDGSGSFVATSSITSPWPFGVGAADMDDDGDVDVIVANKDNSTITVHFSDGMGNYPLGTYYPASGNPTYLAIADYNSDGYPDIAAASLTATSGTLLMNKGISGMFDGPLPLPFGFTTIGIRAADFNGDGRMDLAASAVPDAQLAVLLGNGDGSFQTPMVLGNLKNSYSVDAADLNGDGKPDLVTTSVEEAKVGIFLNACP
jgi:hypothetical protein